MRIISGSLWQYLLSHLIKKLVLVAAKSHLLLLSNIDNYTDYARI